MKLDLLMWTTGKPTLIPCLKQISRVIPKEVINEKYLITTRLLPLKVADYGWHIIEQKGVGIGNAAQTGLYQVETPLFMTFEDDVILCRDWFERIIKHMKDPKVAVAQGWRISTNPTMRAFDEVGVEWFRNKLWSIDNNIYRTDLIRKYGFDQRSKWFTDHILKSKLERDGYKWITNTTVISQHLQDEPLLYYAKFWRKRFSEEASFVTQYTLDQKERRKFRLWWQTIRLIASPVLGIGMALKKHTPALAYFYPIWKLYRLLGTINA